VGIRKLFVTIEESYPHRFETRGRGRDVYLQRASHRGCLFPRRVQSQLVGTILNGVVAMTSGPLPVDLVPLADLIKLVPQILVQDGIAIGLHPAI